MTNKYKKQIIVKAVEVDKIEMESGCEGCIFYERIVPCSEMVNLLYDRGLPDCFDGYIYKIEGDKNEY